MALASEEEVRTAQAQHEEEGNALFRMCQATLKSGDLPGAKAGELVPCCTPCCLRICTETDANDEGMGVGHDGFLAFAECSHQKMLQHWSDLSGFDI
jgi:hypothetical protein